MEDIQRDLQALREEVKELKNIMLRLEKSCSNMDHHIAFVDHVYERVQTPINYVLTKVSRMMGRPQQALLEKNPSSCNEDSIV